MSRYTRICYEDVADCCNKVTQGPWLKTVQQGDDAETCCRMLVQGLIESFSVMFKRDSKSFCQTRFNRLFRDHNKETYFDD